MQLPNLRASRSELGQLLPEIAALPRQERADNVIDWPFQPELFDVDPAPTYQLEVDLNTKRYPVIGCQQDRFTARLTSNDRSPLALVAALHEAMAKIEELRQAEPDEPVILEIRLAAV